MIFTVPRLSVLSSVHCRQWQFVGQWELLAVVSLHCSWKHSAMAQLCREGMIFVVYGIRSAKALAGLGVASQPWVALNKSSWVHHSIAEIPVPYHHAWPRWCWESNLGLCAGEAWTLQTKLPASPALLKSAFLPSVTNAQSNLKNVDI